MSFFGALFASMTLALQFGWTGAPLLVPFLAFAAIATGAVVVIRSPGIGVSPSDRVRAVIMWSSVAEGVGLFLAANVVINIGHREMLLPAMALVVGLHFIPIAIAVPFRPFLILGAVLLTASALGFSLSVPTNGVVAGFAASTALLTAALLAIRRDIRARTVWNGPESVA